MKIEYLDLVERTCVLEGGRSLPIVEFFDADGDECHPDEALSCVAGEEGFGWIEIDMSGMSDLTVH